MAGELLGALKREGWAPSGALSGAVGSVREARRGVRASRGELLRAFGRSFWSFGDNFRMLARCFLIFSTKLTTKLTTLTDFVASSPVGVLRGALHWELDFLRALEVGLVGGGLAGAPPASSGTPCSEMN